MFDPTRYEQLKRDPTLGAKIEIKALCFEDGTMQIEGPFGDRELFLMLIDQMREAVKAKAFSKGWLIVPGRDTDARPNPEGYK
jgi:hypothetical protein